MTFPNFIQQTCILHAIKCPIKVLVVFLFLKQKKNKNTKGKPIKTHPEKHHVSLVFG